MKLIKGVYVGIALLGSLYAATAYTAPAEGEITWWYDENGVQVGYSEQTCTGKTNYYGTTNTDYYEIKTYSCGYPPCKWSPYLDCR